MNDKNSYINEMFSSFNKQETHMNIPYVDELKMYIINDLKKLGVDIKKINFFIDMYGIQKRNISFQCKNEYTREILFKNTRKQIERKMKLLKLGLDDE
jgi:DNA-binding transcriptional MerR regulator